MLAHRRRAQGVALGALRNARVAARTLALRPSDGKPVAVVDVDALLGADGDAAAAAALAAGAPWTDGDRLHDKAHSGWGCAHEYHVGGGGGGGGGGGAEAMEVDGGAPKTAARVEGLGEEAEALLSDAAHLEKVLQWLVTDHREADEQGGARRQPGGADGGDALPARRHLRRAARGRRWPHAESHGVGGHNFVLPNAQLFKGLAATSAPPASSRRCCRRSSPS